MQWEQAPTATADLKFRTAGSAVARFTAAICTFNKDGSKWFVLQLLPAFEPASAAPVAPSCPAVPTRVEIPKPAASILPTAPIKIAADAGGMVLKQKLDCALQLARTVSLDFNNALTSMLGHTSLLLSKAEAGHPWRHSLMEVEKSAARAAEIANELAHLQPAGKGTAPRAAGQSEPGAEPLRGFFPQCARRKNSSWNLQLERDLFGARFDEAKMQQAFTKILENAVEAVGLEGRARSRCRREMWI